MTWGRRREKAAAGGQEKPHNSHFPSAKSLSVHPCVQRQREKKYLKFHIRCTRRAPAEASFTPYRAVSTPKKSEVLYLSQVADPRGSNASFPHVWNFQLFLLFRGQDCVCHTTGSAWHQPPASGAEVRTLGLKINSLGLNIRHVEMLLTTIA